MLDNGHQKRLVHGRRVSRRFPKTKFRVSSTWPSKRPRNFCTSCLASIAMQRVWSTGRATYRWRCSHRGNQSPPVFPRPRSEGTAEHRHRSRFPWSTSSPASCSRTRSLNACRFATAEIKLINAQTRVWRTRRDSARWSSRDLLGVTRVGFEVSGCSGCVGNACRVLKQFGMSCATYVGVSGDEVFDAPKSEVLGDASRARRRLLELLGFVEVYTVTFNMVARNAFTHCG